MLDLSIWVLMPDWRCNVRSNDVVNRCMRITFVTGPFFPVPAVLGSAVERWHLALAEEMAGRGHRVAMISRTYGDFPNEEMRNGVRHMRVPSWDAPRSRFLFRIYDLLYSLRVARRL